jgi:hypothetical protein
VWAGSGKIAEKDECTNMRIDDIMDGKLEA